MIERLTEYKAGRDAIVNAVELEVLEEDFQQLEALVTRYQHEAALLRAKYEYEIKIYEETLNAKLES